MPDDPREALAQQIREELENIELLAQRAEAWLQGRREEPAPLEIMGAGKIVHDFYTGAERIFERIAVQVDDYLPAGLHSHPHLLRQMERPWGEKRPALLDHGLALRLHRYTRFRHLFRHTYGYELVLEELRPLAEGLPAVLADLNARLQPFLVPESG